MTEKTIYDLELNERLRIQDGVTEGDVLRVPGGWIYRTYSERMAQFDDGRDRYTDDWRVTSATFVPYHNEFKPEPDSDLPF